MKKISINTFGCKVNQYESASFRSGFEERGHQVGERSAESDIVVINTCSVTSKAGAQSRQAIRRAVREHPGARIVITGCYAQMAAAQIEAMPELKNRPVSIVGNADKHLLVDTALAGEERTVVRPPGEGEDGICHLPARNFGGRTRAYLRIQDGCNAFCSYCIVPYTRGRSRSLEPERVVEQARIFQDEGYREIVVTGIHVGYYGQDLSQEIDLPGILARLCRTAPGIRIRLSSIEPLEITPSLLRVIAENDNFMPHLHIPLQSGSDDILWRMNRRYTTREFADIVDRCRQTIEDVAIGIDILAGFPGETDELFAETSTFLDQLDFTYLHVFPYSRRPGTPAAEFPGQVDKRSKQERVARLRQLGETKKGAFCRRFAGSVREVLIESSRTGEGLLRGFTDNYIAVVLEGGDELKNTITPVTLNREERCIMHGTPVATNHER